MSKSKSVMMSVGCLVLVILLGSVPVEAIEQEGMTWEELAANNPPQAAGTSVAVMPFWATNERQTELARGAVLLNLLRLGFQLVPEVGSLAAVAAETDNAVEADTEREPGARLGRQDATRVGQLLGAQYAIYGEIEALRTDMHRRFFRNRKVGAIDIRFVIVNTESGEILYWTRIQDTGSGGTGFWAAKATSIERRLLVRTVNHIFDDIARALPGHSIGPEVTQEQVQEFVEEMGL